MLRSILWRSLPPLVLLSLALGCSAPTPAPSPTPQASAAQAPCLQAALRAVDAEIQRYQGWLDQTTDPQQREAYQQALAYLKDLRQRLQALPAETPPWQIAWAPVPGGAQNWFHQTTPLPAPTPIVLDEAWLEGPLPAQIHFPTQTRSGPFYTATGVSGDLALQPEKRYRLTLQPLMPATYPFPSFYVCILQAEPRAGGSP